MENYKRIDIASTLSPFRIIICNHTFFLVQNANMNYFFQHKQKRFKCTNRQETGSAELARTEDNASSDLHPRGSSKLESLVILLFSSCDGKSRDETDKESMLVGGGNSCVWHLGASSTCLYNSEKFWCSSGRIQRKSFFQVWKKM